MTPRRPMAVPHDRLGPIAGEREGTVGMTALSQNRPAYDVTDMSGCLAVAQEIACCALFVVGVVALLWVCG